MIQTQANGEKPYSGPDLGPLNPNLSHHFFSWKIWLCQSLDIMIRYQNVKYEKKTNDSILRTFSNGWTDAQTTDRQTDVQRTRLIS